jgi:hypothetical protein
MDPIASIRSGGVDPRKAIIDYAWVVRLAAKTGLRLQSDHAQWETPEMVDLHAHQVVAMQMVIEQWFMQASSDLDRQVMVLSPVCATQTCPDLTAVLARNQLYRELFPQMEAWQHVSPVMPAWDAGIVGLIGQTGVVVHQAAEIKRLRDLGAIFKPLAHECQFNDHGQISRRMHTLLDRCAKELLRIHRSGWGKVVAQDHGGLLAMSSFKAGVDSVIEKDRRYWNPLDDWLR